MVDPMDDLEARLNSHARAFESLLALTPAKDYYGPSITGQDPSEQWNKKKQTSEQKRAAKKAKLNPANQKSALDIMREREAEAKETRKREAGDIDSQDEEAEDVQSGVPEKPNKRQKLDKPTEEELAARKRAKAERKKEKREVRKQKAEKKRARAEAKKAAKQDQDLSGLVPLKAKKVQTEADDKAGDDDVEDAEPFAHPNDLEAADFSGLAASENEEDVERDEVSSVPTSPNPGSPSFDIGTNHSAASSSSSIVPPSTPGDINKPTTADQPPKSTAAPTPIDDTAKPVTDASSGTSTPSTKLPRIDQEQLQARLKARIEELRARRKADGPDGKPARNRQELLDQRRKKQEQRKQHKKELRQKQKEDEQRATEERLRGSGSPLSADIFSPVRSPARENNSFSFSRLAFSDGASASTSGLQDPKRKKGPQDPKTALLAAEKKAARINSYDDAKKADIGEKDMWLNAKKRAHGERVRDDQSLLKKALKRQEKQKGKSEKEWSERQDSVMKGQEFRQKKREANLQKRKDEKGQKGKKKGPQKGKAKKKGRPGFEGRFKA